MGLAGEDCGEMDTGLRRRPGSCLLLNWNMGEVGQRAGLCAQVAVSNPFTEALGKVRSATIEV